MAEVTRVDGVLFKRSLFGSRAWLGANRERVNQLNVFPVPDGDTGTNMLLTLESAIEEIADEESSDLSLVSSRVAHGALMGARGNSGVILSQILRGFSQGVGDATTVDCRQLAHAFEEATSVAYRGVTKPTEGTILTVARKVSEAAVARAETITDVGELIQVVVSAAQRAVDETPSQLAVLREAGVVDAGGYGLMVILEGFLKTIKGQEIPGMVPALAPAPGPDVARIGAHALDIPEEGWGFCTEFLIDAPSKPFAAVREELTPMGNSAVIVGDDALVRVHIHTLDPGALIAHATGYGMLQKLKVEDMSRQHHEILAHDAPAAMVPVLVPSNGSEGPNGASAPITGLVGVVAVAVGDGFRRIFEDLGASVVEGGQTMNPSTEDLLQAVNAVTSDQVIILPNNKNVIMTAQQVEGLCEKQVRVVPSRTVPQGIAALLSIDPEGDLDGTTAAMTDSLEGIQTIEVTTAVRSTSVDGLKIKNGDSIAVVNGKIRAAGKSPLEVIDGALDALQTEGFELLTVYAGADIDEAALASAAAHIQERYPALSVEAQRGEQSHYPFILSLE